MKPYPWPESMMLMRNEAPEVYEVEDKIREQFEVLELELEPFVTGGKWTHVVPYMLFCTLAGYDREAAIAAALGFLKHIRNEDLKNKTKRASLKGLRLPSKPTA